MSENEKWVRTEMDTTELANFFDGRTKKELMQEFPKELLQQRMKEVSEEGRELRILDIDSLSGHLHTKMLKIFVCINGSITFNLHSEEQCGICTIDELGEMLIIYPNVWYRADGHLGELLFLEMDFFNEDKEDEIIEELPCNHPMATSLH